ncbi:MAG: hypothetical protein A2V81_03125 [Candidatus Abawacabacteria bacterium RBG_16_42_10]|uniref:Small ribosomal subunit protein bS20 n=1 Tax=Candidatus Abawacabacteria bacterium RBG_16_42_10 TaxID=1817814 RepID=A0A1F4XK82_9BACT|nr:MAG: hypothetical protein A2V81_03125 [Candidatus Abawacabacteria bacterium RBG_16_42_10]
MPVIKSVFKNVRVNERKRLINLKTKNSFKNEVKEIKQLLLAKKIAEAEKLLPKVYKVLDIAAKKHVIAANSAARKKSSLARQIAAAKK